MICLFFLGRDFGIEAPIERTDLNAYAIERVYTVKLQGNACSPPSRLNPSAAFKVLVL